MTRDLAPPGLIIAAPRSGAGKTTVTLGLMRAFRNLGLSVQPFKCGPDYIDPAFHEAAAGRPSFNLDTWSMRRALIEHLCVVHTSGADLVIAEGVMGLFDGVTNKGQTARGSTADLAALTGWPVVLVLDVSGQSETAAAIALGCATYRHDVRISGVILNRIASARQVKLIAPHIEALGIPVFGWLDRNDALSLSERHLGLVQAIETSGLDDKLDAIAAAMQGGIDLDKVRAAARPYSEVGGDLVPIPPPGQRIAIARDQAFAFAYPHLLTAWRGAGAELVPFSPLADEAPCAAADAIWLPGGYPELHAGTLGSAERFKSGLSAAALRHVPVHGECGGYMVLGQGLEDKDGTRHAMAGLLGLETSYANRRLHLGFREAVLEQSCSLGAKGATVFGHEFHYASVLSVGDEPLVKAFDANRDPVAEQGSRRGTVTGTFFHVVDSGEAMT